LRFVFTALSFALLAEIAALAQVVAPGVPTTAQPAQVRRQKDWTIGVGVAAIYAPVWQGSREQSLAIFPDLRINYRDSVFFSIPDGLGWNAVNKDGWKIGPLFKFRFGRDENNGGSPFLITGGSDALIGMGNIGFAGEPGAFVEYSFANKRVRARAEMRAGFGGHTGLVADTSIGWSDSIGTPTTPGFLLYSAALRATFAGQGYNNTYFGVNQAQSASTGLPVSVIGSGLVSTGINFGLVKPIGKYGQRGSVVLFGGYDRLADTVADSSLIEQRGKRDQFSLGLSYGLRFGFGGSK
jgi:outer membrane scaffolding protein for murein synthesis (MipA/OmpV family)